MLGRGTWRGRLRLADRGLDVRVSEAANRPELQRQKKKQVPHPSALRAYQLRMTMKSKGSGEGVGLGVGEPTEFPFR